MVIRYHYYHGSAHRTCVSCPEKCIPLWVDNKRTKKHLEREGEMSLYKGHTQDNRNDWRHLG